MYRLLNANGTLLKFITTRSTTCQSLSAVQYPSLQCPMSTFLGNGPGGNFNNLTTPLKTASNKRDMAPFLTPNRASSSSHVALWTAEKAVSAALLPIIPAAFIFPSPLMDYLLALTITLHSHWGIEAIVVDYVRPAVFGEVVPKIGIAMVFALSALMLGGLCYFTYTDVGLVQAIKMLWKL